MDATQHTSTHITHHTQHTTHNTHPDLQSAGKERQLSICVKLAKEEQVAIAAFREQTLLLHDGNDHWLLTFSLMALFKCVIALEIPLVA